MELSKAAMTSVAVGLGCRKNVPAHSVVALVREALARLPQPPAAVTLYTSERKSQEAGLREAAATLGYRLVFLADADLSAVGARVITRSAKAREATGLESVSEAAALAGGGPKAHIVVARITSGGVACAIASASCDPGERA
jgi:cobalt-precorrin 5A hydrolase